MTRQQFQDLLGLNPAQREALLREIPVAPRRRAYRAAGIPVVIVHPGGSASSYLVTTHSIWWRGLAFIHGGYLHGDSECRLLLRTLSGHPRRIGGRVASCRLLRDRVHDIEVEFDEPVDVELICSAPEATESEIENGGVKSETFAEAEARALLLGESEVDRAIIAEMLGGVGIGVSTVSTAEEAIVAISNRSFKVVVTDLDHCSGPGDALIERLRTAGLSAPIIGITGASDSKTLRSLRKAGLSTVLAAPVDRAKLVETVSSYLAQQESRKSATLSRRGEDGRSGPRPVYGPGG